MLRHLALLAGLALAASLAFAGPTGPRSVPGSSGLDPQSRACLACHTIALEHSHPVGMRSRPVAGLPLTERGAVACRTCHQQPASLRRHALSAGQGAELRRPPASLCVACHSASAAPGSVLAHGLRLQRAHLIPGARDTTDNAGQLDRESRLCLSCHDGGLASSASVRVVSGGGSSTGARRSLAPMRGPSWKTEHPIGVPFPSRHGDVRDQARPGALPDGVRLFSGNVGCGSCHSVYSGIDEMLSVTRRGSALCLACHTK